MDKVQSTNTIVMVRPANFGYNQETAANNAFQVLDDRSPKTISQTAIQEFDKAVQKLKDHGIKVIVWQDKSEPKKTDAVFPNNWFSTHQDGTLLLYPMFSKNRRLERDPEFIEFLNSSFEVTRDYTMTHYEDENLFLEGTGSIIIDHVNNLAYACGSIRTDASLFDKWCVINNLRGIYFNAQDKNGQAIYHTNVMMALGTDYAVICLDSITSEESKNKVVDTLTLSGKKIIALSTDQMNRFAGNMIELRGQQGQKYLVMSQTAFDSLSPEQLTVIKNHVIPLTLEIPTIERYGGGSARCMIAEIFLAAK
jgi:hypothetical protein